MKKFIFHILFWLLSIAVVGDIQLSSLAPACPEMDLTDETDPAEEEVKEDETVEELRAEKSSTVPSGKQLLCFESTTLSSPYTVSAYHHLHALHEVYLI